MSQNPTLIRLGNMNPEFASAMEGSRRRLLVLVRNIVGDDALAEDIVQDTILIGLRTVSEGNKVSCPEAWLMRVARNRALDTVRSAGFSRSVALEAAWRQDSGESLEVQVGMKDRVRQVKEVVRSLPESQRTVFILRDVLEYDMKDIAEVLGMGEANVRQQLSRTRKKIREYLINNE